MRIVKAGHIKPKEIFCSGCGATLEYTKNDIYKPCTSNSKYVTCPLCLKPILIDGEVRNA